jgi:hypothetical protein
MAESRFTAQTVALLVAALCVSVLPGCSLITIESPAEPLPERDLRARALTREFALSYATAIAIESNRIMASSESLDTRLSALRWKIDSTSKAFVASTHMSPLMALVDTWTLTAQTHEFMHSGQSPFASTPLQPELVETTVTLRSQVEMLARRVFNDQEFRRMHLLVADHARDYPVVAIDGARVPVTNNPDIASHDDLLALTTVGTPAEAMSDIADRMRLYGMVLQYSTRWQVELLALESGIGSDDVKLAIQNMDSHFSDLADFASASPEIAEQAAADLEKALRNGTADIEEASLMFMTALTAEREALFEELDEQWRFLAVELDAQRAATATDLERIASGLADELWVNMDQLANKLSLLLIVLIVLILTLPFGAGYLLGRAQRVP